MPIKYRCRIEQYDWSIQLLDIVLLHSSYTYIYIYIYIYIPKLVKLIEYHDITKGLYYILFRVHMALHFFFVKTNNIFCAQI